MTTVSLMYVSSGELHGGFAMLSRITLSKFFRRLAFPQLDSTKTSSVTGSILGLDLGNPWEGV